MANAKRVGARADLVLHVRTNYYGEGGRSLVGTLVVRPVDGDEEGVLILYTAEGSEVLLSGSLGECRVEAYRVREYMRRGESRLGQCLAQEYDDYGRHMSPTYDTGPIEGGD